MSVDTGGLLSWSSACAIWPDSRTVSSLGNRRAGLSKRDAHGGDGLFIGPSEVPPVAAILARVEDFPEPPSLVVGDPHRFAELQEWARSRGVRCALRGGRSSNLVGDVQAARGLLLDAGAAFALGAPLLRLAAGEVSLTGDGRGLKKIGRGRDDPLRAFLLCAGAAQPRAAPLAGVVHGAAASVVKRLARMPQERRPAAGVGLSMGRRYPRKRAGDTIVSRFVDVRRRVRAGSDPDAAL